MLLVMTTHELLLLYHGGLSASLLIIIVWLPVLSTVLRPCHVKLLSQTFTVLSHYSYQPKVDDSFQDLVIHMKGHWCLAVRLPCCCNVLLSICSTHYMQLSFLSLLHVQFLCLFTCRSAIILVNINCRCAVVTVGCDRLLVADIEVIHNKMAAEGNFLDTYGFILGSQGLRSHPL